MNVNEEKELQLVERGMEMVMSGRKYHVINDYTKNTPYQFCKDEQKDWYFVMEHGVIVDGKAYDDIVEARAFCKKLIKEYFEEKNEDEDGEL